MPLKLENIAWSVVLVVCLLVPASGFAQETGQAEEAGEAAEVDEALVAAQADGAASAQAPVRRVAVLALSEGARSGSVMETLLELLDADGFDVIGEERLRLLLAESLVPETPARVASQFVGLTSKIGRGIEKFFYKGNESALEILTPVVNLGMAHAEVLTRRPDFARQIFEAGVVMVRAYRNLDRHDDARRIARSLVETFPGFEARTDSAPPKITALLQKEREALRRAGHYMRVEMVAGEGCQAIVNGTAVGQEKFPVSPSAHYFVTMECGKGEAPVWKAKARAGELTVVPVAARHPLDYQMPNAGFRHRKLAEGYLQMAAFWAGTPRALGVAEAADAADSVVLVHVGMDGGSGWSDRADQKSVSRMLARVMTDYSADGSHYAGSGAAGSEPVDWVSWSLVGGGVAVMGASTWGLIAADARRRELRCSPSVSSDASPAECEGVPVVEFANDEEFQDATTEVDVVTVLSGSGLAVGAALTGWGIYRLLSTPESATPQAVTWQVGVSADGASVAAGWRF